MSYQRPSVRLYASMMKLSADVEKGLKERPSLVLEGVVCSTLMAGAIGGLDAIDGFKSNALAALGAVGLTGMAVLAIKALARAGRDAGGRGSGRNGVPEPRPPLPLPEGEKPDLNNLLRLNDIWKMEPRKSAKTQEPA